MMVSCNGKTAAKLENTSPNQKVHTTVTGTRSSSVDPWKVVIDVKAFDFQKGQLKFEIYADDLTDQNVQFSWKDDETCLITFTERDDKRVFQLLANANQVQLGQI
jgi:hypothetical protein